jgi:hypothetical protein
VVELVGPARVVEEPGRHQRDVDVARLADRLAVVERLEHRQLAGALLQDAGDPEEVLAALPGRMFDQDRSWPARRATAGPTSPAGLGDLGEHLSRSRADVLKRPSVGRRTRRR